MTYTFYRNGQYFAIVWFIDNKPYISYCKPLQYNGLWDRFITVDKLEQLKGLYPYKVEYND